MTDADNNDFEIDLGAIEETSSDEIEIDLGDLGLASDEEEAPVVLADEPEADADEDEQELDKDDALAAAIEELRQELESKYGEWYVIHTYSGMENRVKQNVDSRAQSLNMEDYIFETVVPTEEVVEVRNNARKTVTRCVLPGYVLIRMELTDDSWSVVRQTPSVTGFVMVVDGPFTGVHATITEINANTSRLRALVEILGRETPVDLEFKQVEKVV